MSVWLCIPSARPAEQVEPVLAKWRSQGYKIALWRDDEVFNTTIATYPFRHDYVKFGVDGYPGYAQAVNELAQWVLKEDPSCDWIVTGGDDTLPDLNHTADEIAEQCSNEFAVRHLRGCQDKADTGSCAWIHEYQTFGVMQPTGDRFAGGCIDRIAGSPWLGREWCLRANQGKGPFWPEFTHMFSDECLKRTAEKLGVYWARPDLIHMHNHFQRKSDAIDAPAVSKPIPPHLQKWNTKKHWDEMQAIFRRLEAEDFKSCLPG